MLFRQNGRELSANWRILANPKTAISRTMEIHFYSEWCCIISHIFIIRCIWCSWIMALFLSLNLNRIITGNCSTLIPLAGHYRPTSQPPNKWTNSSFTLLWSPNWSAWCWWWWQWWICFQCPNVNDKLYADDERWSYGCCCI